MRGILPRHKKGVSELISYSLIIIIALAAAVLVYNYLKVYVPKNTPECPDSTSIIVTDYSCSLENTSTNFTVSLVNKGKFNIDAAYIRIGVPGRNTKTLINGQTEEELYFFPPLSPSAEIHTKSILVPVSVISAAGDYVLEIEPAVLDGKTNQLAACSGSIISQEILCAGTLNTSGTGEPPGGGESIACYSDSDCISPVISPNIGTVIFPYCSGVNLCQDRQYLQCINPGTTSSYCSTGTTSDCILCQNGCSNNACNPLVKGLLILIQGIQQGDAYNGQEYFIYASSTIGNITEISATLTGPDSNAIICTDLPTVVSPASTGVMRITDTSLNIIPNSANLFTPSAHAINMSCFNQLPYGLNGQGILAVAAKNSNGLIVASAFNVTIST